MPAKSKEWSIGAKVSVVLGIAMAIWVLCFCIAIAGLERAGATSGSPDGVSSAHIGSEPMLPIAAGEDTLRSRLERLSEQDMKAFYSRCSQEGIERRLDGGEAMACSIGYEILLRKHFSGDFERLLAWSRGHGREDRR